jgi:Stage II sporulation protein E (SpoIIE)
VSDSSQGSATPQISTQDTVSVGKARKLGISSNGLLGNRPPSNSSSDTPPIPAPSPPVTAPVSSPATSSLAVGPSTPQPVLSSSPQRASAQHKSPSRKGHPRSAKHRSLNVGPARTLSAPTTLLGGAGSTLAASPKRSKQPLLRGLAHRSMLAALLSTSNPLQSIGRQIPLPIPVPDWSKPIILALLLLALWFAIRSRFASRRAQRLQLAQAALLGDLAAMQAALVPPVPAQLGGLAVSVAYQPAAGPAAGGDFYDVFELVPGKVAVVLGDISGHGKEAISHAALTRYTLRAYLQAGLSPRGALALAGRVLEDPGGERFATVAVALYESHTNRLTYALAGHLPPIVSGFAAPPTVTRCASPPIGWGVTTGRRQTTITLPAGANVCFFSDGLIEARANGALVGRERLVELFDGLGAAPAAERLLEQVQRSSDERPDDMVACVISPQSGVPTEVLWIEELEVQASALGTAHVKAFLADCGVSPSDIAGVLRSATGLARTSGSALLRVEHTTAGVLTSVTEPQPSSDIPGVSPGPSTLQALTAH